MEHVLRKAIAEIEDVRFAVEVGVASGLKTAVHIAGRHSATRALVELAAQSGKRDVVTAEVLDRIRRLALESIDESFESPWDCALLAYLLVVDEIAPTNMPTAEDSAREARNLWFAEKWLRQRTQSMWT